LFSSVAAGNGERLHATISGANKFSTFACIIEKGDYLIGQKYVYLAQREFIRYCVYVTASSARSRNKFIDKQKNINTIISIFADADNCANLHANGKLNYTLCSNYLII